MLKLKTTNKMVHEWSQNDGQGNYCFDASLELETEIKSLSFEDIANGINEMLYLHEQEIEADSVKDSLESLERISIAVIENSDGYEDSKGKYICDYDFEIEKIESLNFENILKSN